MLVKFICENFLSFKNEIVLDIVASKNNEHRNHILFDNKGKEVSMLRAAVLYGANASGKSNLIKAIQFAKNFIVLGTKGDQPISVTPFKLREDPYKKPSHFEFLIKYKGIFYEYGFVISREKVIEEWLYITKSRRNLKCYERTTNEKDKAMVEFGSSFVKERSDRWQFLKFVGEGTRPNQLFLTEANNRNVEELKPLFKWFQNVLQIITPGANYVALPIRVFKDKEFTKFLGQFLKYADTGIEKICTKKEKLDFNLHFPGMPEEIKEEIAKDVHKRGVIVLSSEPSEKKLSVILEIKGTLFILKLMTEHKMTDNQNASFEVEEESDGTYRLMHLIPALIDLTKLERVFVIDELDRSLHPMLTKKFIEYFLNCTPKNSRSQLIFTTHEIHLLDLDLMRRDEIWFLEKDKEQSSVLYSLSDFKPRTDLKIEKGYLQGRFGAIPFFGDPAQLGLVCEQPKKENLKGSK